MAAEAQRKGFFQANRKAFVADGMKCNWTIWKQHFGWQGFIPMVDFIHVLSYLYKAALAIGEDEDFGWGLYADWMRACWQGRVSDVIAELTDWLAAGPPLPDDIAEDDPREIVRRSLGYLVNNRQRMNYPDYRRQGLPVTSTLMESLIKEMNYREVAQQIEYADWKASALIDIASAQIESGDKEQTLATLKQAVEAAQKIEATNTKLKAESLRAIASALAKVGEIKQALEVP